MKEKEKLKMSPSELADYLEKTAKSLREGKFEIQGRRFGVPEKIKVKASAKEKKGVLAKKIAFEWSTLENYAPDDKREVIRWKDSLKTIKKRLAGSMKILYNTAESGNIPDAAVLSEFISDSEKFAEFAEPEWKEEMEEYMDHLENLRTAVEEGRIEAVRHELRDLKSRTKACHREYK